MPSLSALYSTCTAKASLSSHRSMSSTLRPRRFEHLGHREHRADAHLVGLAAGDREAEEAAERLQALLLGVGLADDDAGAGAVAELAGVAGGDHAAGHRGADVLDALVGGARAQAFVGARR